jgi:hypothetical protein
LESVRIAHDADDLPRRRGVGRAHNVHCSDLKQVFEWIALRPIFLGHRFIDQRNPRRSAGVFCREHAAAQEWDSEKMEEVPRHGGSISGIADTRYRTIALGAPHNLEW